MILFGQIIFWLSYAILLIFLIVLSVWWRQKKDLKKFAKITLAVFFAVKLTNVLFKIYLFYGQTKNSPLEPYLGGLKTGYFRGEVRLMAADFLWQIVLTAGVLIIGLAIMRYQKKPYLDENAPLILAISALGLAYPGFLVAFLFSLILAVIYQIIMALRGTGGQRVELTPFVLISSILILLSSFFSIYYQLLILLRLI